MRTTIIDSLCKKPLRENRSGLQLDYLPFTGRFLSSFFFSFFCGCSWWLGGGAGCASGLLCGGGVGLVSGRF